jgi:hypothetical protein
MGGKEERVSEVGRARAREEAEEARGVEHFDIVPGPRSDELLRGPKGRRTARPVRKVSRKPRAGPTRLEPEDKITTRQNSSLTAKFQRQPKEQIPRNPGEN